MSPAHQPNRCGVHGMSTASSSPQPLREATNRAGTGAGKRRDTGHGTLAHKGPGSPAFCGYRNLGRTARVISGERDEMTINTGSAEPAVFSRAARQATRQGAEARRRQYVITLVVLVAAARAAVDRRTVVGAITLAIGLVAASRLAKERGTPGLDWYLRRGSSRLTGTLALASGVGKRARSNLGTALQADLTIRAGR